MISLTWWEYDELLEHLHDREDIWMQSEENPLLWMRTQEDEAVCALYVTLPADATAQFRQYQIAAIPMAWDEERSRTYLIDLASHWTTYGHRMGIEKLLITELSIPEETAALAAIAIESFDWIDLTEPDHKADVLPACVDLVERQSNIGTYLLAGGGWARLTYLDGMIRVAMSLPNRDTGGYSHPFEGFVRPKHGRVEEAAAALAGWPVKWRPRDIPDDTAVQLPLPKEANG